MKRKNLFQIRLILLILLFALVLNADAEIKKYSTFIKDKEVIFITFDFPKPVIKKVGKYHEIEMEDLINLGDTGLPELPVRTVKILLPYNMEIAKAKVFKGNKVTIPGSYFIKPAQRLYPISYRGPIVATLPDESIYNSVQPFPKTIYSDISIQDKKGYHILLLNLHPVEYIPKNQTLSYYEDIGIRIKVKSTSKTLSTLSPHRFLRGLPQDKADVLRIVDNLEVMETYPVAKKNGQIQPLGDVPLQSHLPPGSYDYVIITIMH